MEPVRPDGFHIWDVIDDSERAKIPPMSRSPLRTPMTIVRPSSLLSSSLGDLFDFPLVGGNFFLKLPPPVSSFALASPPPFYPSSPITLFTMEPPAPYPTPIEEPVPYAAPVEHIVPPITEIAQMGLEGSAFSPLVPMTAMALPIQEEYEEEDMDRQDSSESPSSTGGVPTPEGNEGTGEEGPEREGDENDASRPYVCPICRSTHIRRGHLNAHMRKHTGATPFGCREGCRKLFRTSDQRKRHEDITHKNIWPHECPHCGKRSRRPDQHKKHMRIHDKKD